MIRYNLTRDRKRSVFSCPNCGSYHKIQTINQAGTFKDLSSSVDAIDCIECNHSVLVQTFIKTNTKIYETDGRPVDNKKDIKNYNNLF